MGTAIFSLKMHFPIKCLVVVLDEIVIKFLIVALADVEVKFFYAYWVLETPLSPAPNSRNYAQCICPVEKLNYQPKKILEHSNMGWNLYKSIVSLPPLGTFLLHFTCFFPWKEHDTHQEYTGGTTRGCFTVIGPFWTLKKPKGLKKPESVNENGQIGVFLVKVAY